MKRKERGKIKVFTLCYDDNCNAIVESTSELTFLSELKRISLEKIAGRFIFD